MVDLNRIMSGLANSGVASGLAAGVAGGALGSALTSKKGKKVAKTALKVGGLAAVGGLAWKAYQSYQNGQGQQAGPASRQAHAGVPAGSGFPGGVAESHAASQQAQWQGLHEQDFDAVVADTTAAGTGSMLLIRAMIAAAMADGHMDQGEQSRIFAEVDRLDLTAEEKGALLDELRHPQRLGDIVAQTPDPQAAIEVYSASVLAIDETRAEGRAYLEHLARGLHLPDALVEAVHARAKALPHASAA